MWNQHRKIKGYRELNEREINIMNRIKTKAAEVGELVDDLHQMTTPPGKPSAETDLDGRWVSIGKTHLQQGFMALVRAVARPESF